MRQHRRAEIRPRRREADAAQSHRAHRPCRICPYLLGNCNSASLAGLVDFMDIFMFATSRRMRASSPSVCGNINDHPRGKANAARRD